MKGFAAFVMREPINAGGVAIATLLLGLLLAPFAWLSSATVALVTLRLGFVAVLRVVIPALVVVGAAGLVVLGHAAPVAISALAAWVPCLLLALLLRERVRLGEVVWAAGALGGLIVFALTLAVGSGATVWHDLLARGFPPEVMAARFDLSANAVRHMIEVLAPLMPGVIALSIVISALTSLLLARWWQALLYNPGGFGDEFRGLRLGRVTAAGVLVLIVLAVATTPAWIDSLALVAVAVYIFQGLAVVHGVVQARGLGVGWLVGLYVALAVLMPYVTAALIMLGVVDAWMDYRRRWGTGGTG